MDITHSAGTIHFQRMVDHPLAKLFRLCSVGLVRNENSLNSVRNFYSGHIMKLSGLKKEILL